MPRGIPNRKAESTESDANDAPGGQLPGLSAQAGAEPGAPGPDPDAAPADTPPPVDEQPCSECFPDGWPAGATSVGCIHGQWDRSTAGA